MPRPVMCRTCGNWFMLSDRGCPSCQAGEPVERPPFKLTQDDWNFLKSNRIQPWENDNDDGA